MARESHAHGSRWVAALSARAAVATITTLALVMPHPGVSTPFSADSRPAKTTGPPGSTLGSMAAQSMKWGSHRSRSGNTPASAIVPARNRLGHTKRPTGP